MKEELSEKMVCIRVDIPAPSFFRDAMLRIDPEFEGLGEKLSQILAEEFGRIRAQAGDSDESPNPTGGREATGIINLAGQKMPAFHSLYLKGGDNQCGVTHVKEKGAHHPALL